MLYSDIKENVLKETGITSKQYDVIVDDFWSKIRELLSNPLNANLGLRLSTFGTWWLDIWKIKAVRRKLENTERFVHNREYADELIVKLEKIYKNYKNEKNDNE